MNTLWLINLVVIGFIVGHCLVGAVDKIPVKIKIEKTIGDKDLVYKEDGKGGYHVRYWDVGVPYSNEDISIGRAYNVLKGNPKETSLGGDRGYGFRVFKVDTSAEGTTPDWRYVKPANIDLETKIACDSTRSFKEIDDSSSLQTSLQESYTHTESTSVGVSYEQGGKSAGVGVNWGSTESESFEMMDTVLRSTNKKFIRVEATCSVYEMTINQFMLPEFDPTFKKVINELPSTYTLANRKIFDTFLRAYGTHVVTKATMGSLYGKMYEIEESSLEKFKAQNKAQSKEKTWGVSLEASGGGDASASVGYQNTKGKGSTESKEKEKKLSNMASKEFVYSIGAMPNDDLDIWMEESTKDPAPIHIELTPISSIVEKHFSKEKGFALKRFMSDIKPSGSEPPISKLGKCYIAHAHHFQMSQHASPKSLLARCRRGTRVLGGTFVHMWNIHDDIHTNDQEMEEKKILEHLKKYNKLKNEELETKWLLQHGSERLSAVAKDRAIRHMKEIFGDRVDPAWIKKYLSNRFSDIGIRKRFVMDQIQKSLKTFGKTTLGGDIAKLMKNTPFAKAILKVSNAYFGESKDQSDYKCAQQKKNTKVDMHKGVETLGFGGELENLDGEETDDESTRLEAHIDTLVQLVKHVNNNSSSHVNEMIEDDAKTEIFGAIADWFKQAHDHINGAVRRLFGHVKTRVADALQKWKNFDGSLNSIQKKFGREMEAARKKTTKTDLFQDALAKIETELISHGNVKISARNTLNWMFPLRERTFVCGSGNLGMKPTRHSSFGVCSAYCCDTKETWETRTETSMKTVKHRDGKSSHIDVSCPTGWSVLSGGILLSDYHDQRHTQITDQQIMGDSVFRCGIKWSDVDFIRHSPRYKCFVRCAKSKSETSSVTCQTAETMLQNGHATVACPANTMAVSGGYSIHSNGITYFKKTAFQSYKPVIGAQNFRCEFGSSHDISGKCQARCCHNEIRGQEKKVTKWGRCRNYFRHYTPIGYKMKYGREMAYNEIIQSQNGKFSLTMKVGRKRLYLYMRQNIPCRRPRLLKRYKINIDRCYNDYRKFRKDQKEAFKKRIKEQKKAEKEKKKKELKEDALWKINGAKPQMARTNVVRGSEFKRPKKTFGRLINGADFRRELRLRVNKNGLDVVSPFSPEDGVCSDGIEVGNGSVDSMVVTDIGDLSFFDTNKEGVFSFAWSKCRMLYKQIKAKKTKLKVGEFLTLGQGIVSSSRRHVLVFEVGGALTLYRQHYWPGQCKKPEVVSTTALRGSPDLNSLINFNHNVKAGWILRLNEDNNLVMLDQDGEIKWQTGTKNMGTGPATLFIRDDTFMLRDSTGHIFWNYRRGKIEDCKTLREMMKLRSHSLGVGQVLRIGSNGLVSRSKQYVMLLQKSKHSANLEIWTDTDCEPSRICQLKPDVAEMAIKSDGLHTKSYHGKWTNIFPVDNLLSIQLNDAGHLVALSGTNHHNYQTDRVLLGTCAKQGQKGSGSRSLWYKYGTVDAQGKAKKFHGDVKRIHTAGTPVKWNEIKIVDRGSQIMWNAKRTDWESDGFDWRKQAIRLGSQWYTYGRSASSAKRLPVEWYKIFSKSDICYYSRRNQDSCGYVVTLRVPEGHGELTAITDVQTLYRKYYGDNNIVYRYDLYVRHNPFPV